VAKGVVMAVFHIYSINTNLYQLLIRLTISK